MEISPKTPRAFSALKAAVAKKTMKMKTPDLKKVAGLASMAEGLIGKTVGLGKTVSEAGLDMATKPGGGAASSALGRGLHAAGQAVAAHPKTALGVAGGVAGGMVAGGALASYNHNKQAAIDIKPSHKGKLHEALGVPEGKKIPQAKLEAAKHSKNPALRREANFAENAKGWSHKHASVVAELVDAGVSFETAAEMVKEANFAEKAGKVAKGVGEGLALTAKDLVISGAGGLIGERYANSTASPEVQADPKKSADRAAMGAFLGTTAGGAGVLIHKTIKDALKAEA